MTREYSPRVTIASPFIGEWCDTQVFGTLPPMAGRDGPTDSLPAIGHRLRLLREAIAGVGRTQAKFCRLVDIAPNTWNQYEKAAKRIELDNARKVRARTGASLDWIYDDDESKLPLDLAQKINDLRRPREAAKTAKRVR